MPSMNRRSLLAAAGAVAAVAAVPSVAVALADPVPPVVRGAGPLAVKQWLISSPDVREFIELYCSCTPDERAYFRVMIRDQAAAQRTEKAAEARQRNPVL